MSDIPGINFHWITNIEEFKNRVENLKSEAISIVDSIGKENTITFQKIAQTLANFELKFTTESRLIDIYQHVHPDKEFRDASTEADKILSDLKINLSMRKDVFDQLVKLRDSSTEHLDLQSQKYIERKIKEGMHNGLHCDESVRKEVESIKKELSRLGIDFQKNLSEENCVMEFTEAELEGCDSAFINALEQTSDGKRKVTLKYPHYFPIMKFAIHSDTRRRIEFEFNCRCKSENGPLLEQMLQLRAKNANLLGYETHADYVLSMMMAKHSKTVWNFLRDLKDKLKPLMEQELAMFLEYKKRLSDFDGVLNAWDLRFFMNIYEEERFSVNHKELREYFPLTTVRNGMFEIYQKLLGLTFTSVKAECWHPDVELFSVHDAGDHHLMGYFFLDLHPREGKYGHARISYLQLGGVSNCETGDPVRQVAVLVMLANFTKPTEDRPALLNHDEVVTFFHEFGHIMHMVCSETDFGYLCSFNVERDFVECPSQMLENWCWQKESLKMMSGHYETGEPLDDELLTNLLRSRVANVGVLNTRQLCLATFDQIIHTKSNVDPASVYSSVVKEYMGIPVTEGTNMPASFGHMAGDYDAQYYGYLWSEVFAADMFVNRFLKEGILNPATGRDYREYILKPGSSKDSSDLIEAFLGRPPNQDSFFLLMGLGN